MAGKKICIRGNSLWLLLRAVRILWLVLCVFFFTLKFEVPVVAAAYDPQYAASLIPDSLKKNAYAVVRDYSKDFSLFSLKKTGFTVHSVITVLKKSGDDFAELNLFYDKFKKVKFIRGNIYDENGFLVRKIKASDLSDLSGASWASLFEDIRVKSYKPLLSAYPYTVEYEYEYSIDGSFFFPEWGPVFGYNLSLQHAQLTITAPSGYHVRYRECNIPGSCKITKQGANKLYEWNIYNTRAMEQEAFSPPDYYRIFPTVITAPSDFEMDNLAGNFESWKSFGLWLNKLNEGRDILPESTVQKLNELVKGSADDREKVRRVYKYFQSRTRYVSVQVGIGGLQPFAASVVDNVGYGDCKALSNYARSLLEAVGINSCYTVVKSGDNFKSILVDFPSLQFDHVILMVPMENDTIWLECTNQLMPFNFLGNFTSDREALAITKNGGELVHTQAFPVSENYRNTRATVKLISGGNGTASVSRIFGGLRYDDVFEYLHGGTIELKNWLYSYIDIPNFQIRSSSFSGDSTGKPVATLRLDLDLVNYASESGQRIFIPLNLLSSFSYFPPKTGERRQPIEIHAGFVDRDTITYLLPPGTRLEFAPKPTVIKNEFGSYRASVQAQNNAIVYCREFIIYKGNYPPQRYQAFQQFFQDVASADETKLVLIGNGYR